MVNIPPPGKQPSPINKDTPDLKKEPAEHKGHTWSNITDKAKSAVGGIKGAFSDLSSDEKDCLIVAAAIIGIVAILMVVLGVILGPAMLAAAAPLLFTASLPLALFAHSRYKRRTKSNPAEVAAVEAKQKQIQQIRMETAAAKAALRKVNPKRKALKK